MAEQSEQGARDHGGGLDAAIARWGGRREDWVDLSTGINPDPYPISNIPQDAWTALPDKKAQLALTDAARTFWTVPDELAILAAPGASSLIARVPCLMPPGRVHIPAPTYNEHAAAFAAQGWSESADDPRVRVLVHPNNPTGHWYTSDDLDAPFTVIDESFADVRPDRSLIAPAQHKNTIILKSFGKFWGLAGLRLGFAIGSKENIAQLSDMLGPWPVAGPALSIGAAALQDLAWAKSTRIRLNEDAARLDAILIQAGAEVAGGTALFRLYRVDNAKSWQERLGKSYIWSRIFPYSDNWLRLGLPPASAWSRLEQAL